MKRLEDYRGVVRDDILADLHKRATKLFDKHVVHVNSTAQGGGVAELLSTLVPLMNDVGLDTGWRVLVGTHDFFNVTKSFHNGLQGGEIDLSDNKKQLYVQASENFSTYNHLSRHDAVIIHDPQPLPVIRYYKKRQPWIWRCHIDLSDPNPVLWEYLKSFIMRYDFMIVSHPDYLRPDLAVEQRIINPAIDPFSLKNMDLDEETIDKYLERHNIPRDKPFITQVSRFDRFKDPVGVVEAFKKVLHRVDCRLVLAGNMATDDPEGSEVLEEVKEHAADLLKDGHVVLVLGASDIEINALQRASSVVIQKSTKEGFGLTVSEALWKGTPVVASRVGGIPLQVIDGETGSLVDPYDIDGAADKIVWLLENREEALAMGQRGREHVRENFLMPRLLGHYLSMLGELLG